MTKLRCNETNNNNKGVIIKRNKALSSEDEAILYAKVKKITILLFVIKNYVCWECLLGYVKHLVDGALSVDLPSSEVWELSYVISLFQIVRSHLDRDLWFRNEPIRNSNSFLHEIQRSNHRQSVTMSINFLLLFKLVFIQFLIFIHVVRVACLYAYIALYSLIGIANRSCIWWWWWCWCVIITI